MPMRSESARHAVLFELLRQQNLAERMSGRLRWSRPAVDRDEARLLLSLAVRSWSRPGLRAVRR
ncbi:MAG: hypothetical protein ACK5MY_09695 [Jhaorihella sp.]